MDKNQLIFETNSTFYCLLSRLVLTETRHFERGATPDYCPFNVLVRTHVIRFSYTCLSTYAFLYVRLVCVDMHNYGMLFLFSCISAYVIFRFILVFVHMLYFVLYLY